MAEAQPTSPTFESAMERLQRIVQEMESDTLPLEEMLERYEEGIRLVQVCSEKLAAAEKRIEIVTRNASGKPRIADFETSGSTATPESNPPKPSSKPAPNEDDISLF